MAEHWAVASALLGGTAAMRAAGEALLPKWPNEEQAAYSSRLKTATLFPAFARTVGVMAGKPFSKALTFGEDVPPKLLELCDNVDMQGRNLHSFASDCLAEAVGYGFGGILVDYPTTNGQVRTLADEKAINARPYMVHVKHGRVLGWRAEQSNGATVLTQLRLSESAEVPDGEFGTKQVPRVRVLEPGKWSLYEDAVGRGDYVKIGEGVTTLRAIPFVPFYGERLGFMCGKSPLEELAHLNVKHWQSQSDQDTITHVARVPILAAIGLDDASVFELTVGASAAVKLPQGAELKFVEHSGAAIKAGAESLAALEDQMIQTGAELLVKKPGDRSATESANDAEANKCELQRIVEQFEDALDQALQLMADWIGEPTGGHVSLFKDFSAATLDVASAQLILSLQQGGLITKQTAIREQQRRGMLEASIDPEAELEAVGEEGPALGSMEDDQTDPAAAGA
ncbi:MAG TPA: DUF4055 domain-containing protein [Methylibium sp.]|nr:DUF4055 domain-containing protein [Methylibium sp.]